MPDDRAVCRARVVPACETWTQPAMVDETWTYQDDGGTYICDPCLGRIENFVPVDAVVGDYDGAILRLRERDASVNGA